VASIEKKASAIQKIIGPQISNHWWLVYKHKCLSFRMQFYDIPVHIIGGQTAQKEEVTRKIIVKISRSCLTMQHRHKQQYQQWLMVTVHD